MNFPTILIAAKSSAFFVLEDDFYVRTALTQTGCYSPGELRLFKRLVGEGDVVVDVGAHIGTLAIPLAQHVGPSGRVIAFEPQREIFQILCANAVVNGVRNLEAHWAGAGAAEGVRRLDPLDPETSNYGARRLIAIDGAQGEAGEPCRITPLDALELSACRMIKVDAEGMEEDVLAGAERLLGLQPLVYFENSFFSDTNSRERSIRLMADFQSRAYVLYWHCPPIVEPQDPQDGVFEGGGSVNVLAAPATLAATVDDLLNLHGLIRVNAPADIVYPAWLRTSSVTAAVLEGRSWSAIAGQGAASPAAETVVRALADAINAAARRAGLCERIETPSAAAWTLADIWFSHLEALEGAAQIELGEDVPAAFAAFVRERFAQAGAKGMAKPLLRLVGALGSSAAIPTLHLMAAAPDDHAPPHWREGPAYAAVLRG